MDDYRLAVCAFAYGIAVHARTFSEAINMKEDFSKRSGQSELMDTESISFEEFHDCLLDLEIINILTLAYRPTLRWFKRMLAECDPKQPITVFDIGCGGAGMLRQIWKRNRTTHF